MSSSELLGAHVAALRLLAQGHQHDAIEVGIHDALPRRWPRARPRSARRATVRIPPGPAPPASAIHAIRAPSSEQPVQQNTEGIDIAGGRDGFPAQLLRARALRRQEAEDRAGRIRRRITLENLGDAEVEEPWRAIRGNEDVRGLQIAMNHQMLVSVVDREADEPKQFEPLADIQPRSRQ